MRRLRSAVAAVLFVSAASCASAPPDAAAPRTAPTARSTVVATAAVEPREWEPWPPAAAARTSPRTADSSTTVRLVPKEGGWKIDELFEMIHRQTGASFLYDSTNATFKQAKVEFVGEHVVPENQLFAWFQAVLAYRKLVLVPVGPKAADGRQQWLVMDQADPNLKSRPTFLDESEILDYADRDGLYVVTTLRLRDTLDAGRARNSLAPLATQTAGIGRIQDQGRFLIVGDFAPVVAAMKRLLDTINAETPPSAVLPPPPPPAPTPAAK